MFFTLSYINIYYSIWLWLFYVDVPRQQLLKLFNRAFVMLIRSWRLLNVNFCCTQGLFSCIDFMKKEYSLENWSRNSLAFKMVMNNPPLPHFGDTLIVNVCVGCTNNWFALLSFFEKDSKIDAIITKFYHYFYICLKYYEVSWDIWLTKIKLLS